MRRSILLSCTAVLALTIPVIGLRAEAGPAKLDRVVMFSSGVAFYDHSVEVEGSGTVTLTLPRAHIDDVLKSLIVNDPAGAPVSLSLVADATGEGEASANPFAVGAVGSLEAVLDRLIGQSLTLTGPRTLRGRLLAVQPVDEPVGSDGRTITRFRLALVGEDGMQQAMLHEVGAIRIDDTALQARLDEAIRAAGSQRDALTRAVTLTIGAPAAGSGDKRQVRFGYVAAASLWKASYRLELGASGTNSNSEQGGGTARLQGWAVLENVTGRDWQDVSLTLSSGDAYSVRQALYQTYLIDRPSLPVELPNGRLPPRDGGSIPLAQAAPAPRGVAPAGSAAAKQSFEDGNGDGYAAQAASSAAMPATSMPNTSLPRPAPLPEASVQAEGGQIEFTLPQRITLGAGRSLSVPLVDRAMPARALRLVPAGGGKAQAAVELRNAGEAALPPGAVTVYGGPNAAARSFLGDGRLGFFPKGETRLISYAVDSRLTVLPTLSSEQGQVTGTASGGILRITRTQRTIRELPVRLPPDEALTLVVQVPRGPLGETLTAPEGATVTQSADGYRVEKPLAAGAVETIRIVSDTPVEEVIELSRPSWLQRLRVLLSAPQLDAKLRQAIEPLVPLDEALTRATANRQAEDERRATLLKEQERLRANLQAVPAGSDLHKRYLRDLGQMEDDITRNRQSLEAARVAEAGAQKALQEFVAGLRL